MQLPTIRSPARPYSLKSVLLNMIAERRARWFRVPIDLAQRASQSLNDRQARPEWILVARKLGDAREPVLLPRHAAGNARVIGGQ